MLQSFFLMSFSWSSHTYAINSSVFILLVEQLMNVIFIILLGDVWTYQLFLVFIRNAIFSCARKIVLYSFIQCVSSSRQTLNSFSTNLQSRSLTRVSPMNLKSFLMHLNQNFYQNPMDFFETYKSCNVLDFSFNPFEKYIPILTN